MDNEVTRDAFLGGKIQLWQPRNGYRAGVDPVLLAASVPATPGQSVLDLGCGVGAAALCLGARIAGLNLLGVERVAAYSELARRNGLNVVTADFEALPEDLRQKSFDHVIANPPYFDRAAGHSARSVLREEALGERTSLEVWIHVAARRLKPKGYLHMIHRTERLPEVLTAAQSCLGSLEVLPLIPREGRESELFLLRARKIGRAPFKLHPPRVLHAKSHHSHDEEDYTPEIAAVLRDGAVLSW